MKGERFLWALGLTTSTAMAACDGRSVDMGSPGELPAAGSGGTAGSSMGGNSQGGGGQAGSGQGGILLIGGSAGVGGSAGTVNAGGQAGSGGGKGGSGGAGGSAGAGDCKSACPSGCCDVSNTCVDGKDPHACGSPGHACLDCTAIGYLGCDSDTQACSIKMTNCQPANCPTGCCASAGGAGQYCLDGTSAKACGTGGQICKDCQGLSGTDCDPSSHACSNNLCLSNCSTGCCLGGSCVPGTDPWACGNDGKVCSNCALSGMTCQLDFGTLGGGQCKPPLCNTSNCTGCCVGDVCAVGTQVNACGSGGQICQDCKSQGKDCQGGICQ
jgi:hypothetical protein